MESLEVGEPGPLNPLQLRRCRATFCFIRELHRRRCTERNDVPRAVRRGIIIKSVGASSLNVFKTSLSMIRNTRVGFFMD